MSLRDRFAAHPKYKWYAVGVLTAVYTSSHVDRQIMAILLEPIKLELGASDTQMGFLVGLTFALFYATLGMRSPCWQTDRTGGTSSLRRPHCGAS